MVKSVTQKGKGTESKAASARVGCPVAESPCEALAPIDDFLAAGSRARPADIEAIVDCSRPFLPCDVCRFPAVAAQNLSRVRLGKHERNILVNAALPDDPRGAVIDPELSTHSERETNLRAVRKLSRAGLLRIGKTRVRVQTSGLRADGQAITRSYLMRTVWKTPFGVQIVRFYLDDLQNGRSIRWSRFADEAARATRLEPLLLAREFGNRVAQQIVAVQAAEPTHPDLPMLSAITAAVSQL
jgi:hypothetical protein